MTKTYLGTDLWKIEFDSGITITVSKDEALEIVEEFFEYSQAFDDLENDWLDDVEEKNEKIKELDKIIKDLEIQIYECEKEKENEV